MKVKKQLEIIIPFYVHSKTQNAKIWDFFKRSWVNMMLVDDIFL